MTVLESNYQHEGSRIFLGCIPHHCCCFCQLSQTSP